MNALGVNANRTELAPIEYETWPDVKLPTAPIDIMRFWPWNAFSDQEQGYNNVTMLNEVFGWHNQESKYALGNETRPSRSSSLKFLFTKLTIPCKSL
jgi:hypothetical protein